MTQHEDAPTHVAADSGAERSLMVNAFSREHATNLDPAMAALLDRRERVLGAANRLFYSEPLHLVRGEGSHLFDAQGRDYLDAYNNVPAVGHSNPRVQAVVARQLGELNTHTRYLTDAVVEYAERLTEKFPDPLTQVMYACTGSESVDLALRIVRHATGGQGIIVTRNAYHGTTAAVAEISPSLGANNRIPETVALVDAPDSVRGPGGEAALQQWVSDIERAIAGFAERGIPFAGMIVDSVLSSDGLRLDPTGFLARAAATVRAAGGLYIADEVQPGFGRTGEWWGFSRHGFVPDLVVLGKPMGNGVPISAVVGSRALFDAFGQSTRYFNTFAGNPVSIAAATAVLDEIEDRALLAHSATTGARLLAGITEITDAQAQRSGRRTVAENRGAGLFLSVEYVLPGGDEPDASTALAVVGALRERRILVSASGTYENVLKIRPPLVFSDADVARFLDGFDAVTRTL